MAEAAGGGVETFKGRRNLAGWLGGETRYLSPSIHRGRQQACEHAGGWLAGVLRAFRLSSGQGAGYPRSLAPQQPDILALLVLLSPAEHQFQPLPAFAWPVH